jgi:hypothetical protein
MANNLPTRVCDGCGQIWASGRFLDPTSVASCANCGSALQHRRRVPDSRATEFGRQNVLNVSSNGAAAPANGTRAPLP